MLFLTSVIVLKLTQNRLTCRPGSIVSTVLQLYSSCSKLSVPRADAYSPPTLHTRSWWAAYACEPALGAESEGAVMRWSSEGKVAETGTVTPMELWGRKSTCLEGRCIAQPCWPGGTLETRRSSNITDPACPSSTWTLSVTSQWAGCTRSSLLPCVTPVNLVSFRPPDITVLNGTEKCLFLWLALVTWCYRELFTPTS